MAKKKIENEECLCPVGRFFADLEEVFSKDSVFGKHLDKSRLEFLKAIKFLVDERIDTLEKKGTKKKKRKTRIEVE